MSQEQVTRGIQEVLERNGEDRYQWGHYVERNDGRNGVDDWTPLIYDTDEEGARAAQARHKHDDDLFRNARIVKRAIGPWEIQ